MSEFEIVQAFDHDAIGAGNKGLAIDHDAVDLKVEQLLASMTLDQKINEIRGRDATPIDGLYYAGGDESLGIPPLKMVDGPRGARAGKATAFPVAIARAATFDVDLERRIGEAIGLEVAGERRQRTTRADHQPSSSSRLGSRAGNLLRRHPPHRRDGCGIHLRCAKPRTDESQALRRE
ncbi:MAG: hypothetical protein U5O39_12075 [Gammaproteobacteria bacterium]|nr:hypothetical protein [Gammaproteobacteria bacterium]